MDLRFFAKRFVLWTVLIIGFFLLFGCGGRQTKYGVAKINSTPPGAEVVNLKDNSHLGITPAKVSFPGAGDTSEKITIQLRKLGYKDRITEFWINRRHESVITAEDAAIDIYVELEKN